MAFMDRINAAPLTRALMKQLLIVTYEELKALVDQLEAEMASRSEPA